MEALADYPWPGNVRELKNIIERLAIMTPEQTIEYHLPRSISEASDHLGSAEGTGITDVGTFREAKEEFEKEYLLQKLEEHDWNVSRTAEAIELERSNLHRKIKSFGIELKK